MWHVQAAWLALAVVAPQGANTPPSQPGGQHPSTPELLATQLQLFDKILIDESRSLSWIGQIFTLFQAYIALLTLIGTLAVWFYGRRLREIQETNAKIKAEQSKLEDFNAKLEKEHEARVRELQAEHKQQQNVDQEQFDLIQKEHKKVQESLAEVLKALEDSRCYPLINQLSMAVSKDDPDTTEIARIAAQLGESKSHVALRFWVECLDGFAKRPESGGNGKLVDHALDGLAANAENANRVPMFYRPVGEIILRVQNPLRRKAITTLIKLATSGRNDDRRNEVVSYLVEIQRRAGDQEEVGQQIEEERRKARLKPPGERRPPA